MYDLYTKFRISTKKTRSLRVIFYHTHLERVIYKLGGGGGI